MSLDADRTWLSQHGDRTATDREVLRTVVGSGVHGIAVLGTDDHDEMGVYVETPQAALGIGEVDDHYVARTVAEGSRSRHGDVDLVLYSLRKYLALVTTGNPSALVPLFAPTEDVLVCTDLGARLREQAPSFLSQQAGRRFLGYLTSQRQRMLSGGRRMPSRPELVAQYGYDVKYASPALRLAIQGIEVVTHARLTLPMPEEDRLLVRDVKQGVYDQDDALDLIDERRDRLESLLESLLESGRSPLPERPDLAALSAWSTQEHIRYWDEHELIRSADVRAASS